MSDLRLVAGPLLPRAALGMTVAHLGLGVLVAAIVAMSSWRIEDIRELKPGESFALAGYELRFDGVERFQGPNYQSERGQFMLLRDGSVRNAYTLKLRFP